MTTPPTPTAIADESPDEKAPPEESTLPEPVVQTKPEEPPSLSALAKAAPSRLYLRLKREQMDEIGKLIRSSPGPVPVYLNIPDEKTTLLCPRDQWVHPDIFLLEALNTALGQENVKLVEQRRRS